MKKMYKYILLITLMMFGFVGDVEARNDTGVNSCVDDGACNLYCSYELKNKDNNDYKVNIYYHLPYKGNIQGFYYSIGDGELKSFYDFSYQPYEDGMIEKMKNEKKCPSKIYIDESFWDEACFDDSGTYCSKANKKFSKPVENVKVTNYNNVGIKIPDSVGRPSCYNNWYNVKMGKITEEEAEANGGICFAVCSYFEDEHDEEAVIYYQKGAKSDDEKLFVYSTVFSGSKFLSAESKITGRAFISPTDRSKLITVTEETVDQKICPTNFYHDTNLFDDVCFDSDGAWCSTNVKKFESDEKVEDVKVDEIEDEEREQYQQTVKEEQSVDCDGILKNLSSANNNVYEVCGYAEGNNRFILALSGTNYVLYKGTANDSGEFSLEEITDEKVIKNFSYESSATCTYYKQVYSQSGFTTFSPDKNFLSEDTTMPFVCVARDYSSMTGSDVDNTIVEGGDCISLIGEDLVNEIQSYLLYIKIAVPILIIVMGSIDFGKAFIASDEDAMKKAQKHFIMRIIIGMVIFFIPAILNAFLNIANDVWGIFNDTCGITF